VVASYLHHIANKFKPQKAVTCSC